MTRTDKFISLKSHNHYSRLIAKINPIEEAIIMQFIQDNDSLNKMDFEMKLNRFFLDREKPKNWKFILEFLMISNSEAIS